MLETPQQAACRLTNYKIKEGFESLVINTFYDEKCNPIYWRIRLKNILTDEKFIRPMRLNNKVYELKEPVFENGKPLYNLHLIAKECDKTVYLVEGEKCADALTKLGMLATTSGGASSANDANWQALTNRKVIIWPDNDSAGLQYAKDVIAKLIDLNVSIQQINISCLNLPIKGDCVDWELKFRADNRRDVLKADIENLALKNDCIEAPVIDLKQAIDATVLPLDDNDEIELLAKLSTIEYDRQRTKYAKKLGVQIKTLDKLVKERRDDDNQDDSPFADIEPWPEKIEPLELLDEITSTIRRFIVLELYQAKIAALWVAACWFVNEIHIAPLLLINAPEKACGKTQLLTILARLAPRAAQASSISPSVLFRMIEAYQPTLFIDEVETLLKDNEDLRGLINAGHTRDSAFVWRSVAKGDDFEPKCFTVWGMKAIAGINAIKLAETVTSRSIIIELRRKKESEKVERLRYAETGLFVSLARKLARFKGDYAELVQLARPTLPDALSDREQDNFEPLLQIATVSGGHWLNTSIAAALTITHSVKSPVSSANELLADIQEIFEAKKTIKISTIDLINALCEDSEQSWATYNRGKALSPRQLASKLKDYGISSKTIRLNSYETAKGYEAEQFTDAFERYLSTPDNLPSHSNEPLEVNNDASNDVTATVTCYA